MINYVNPERPLTFQEAELEAHLIELDRIKWLAYGEATKEFYQSPQRWLEGAEKTNFLRGLTQKHFDRLYWSEGKELPPGTHLLKNPEFFRRDFHMSYPLIQNQLERARLQIKSAKGKDFEAIFKFWAYRLGKLIRYGLDYDVVGETLLPFIRRGKDGAYDAAWYRRFRWIPNTVLKGYSDSLTDRHILPPDEEKKRTTVFCRRAFTKRIAREVLESRPNRFSSSELPKRFPSDAECFKSEHEAKLWIGAVLETLGYKRRRIGVNKVTVYELG